MILAYPKEKCTGSGSWQTPMMVGRAAEQRLARRRLVRLTPHVGGSTQEAQDPYFPSIDPAEPTRPATASTAAGRPRRRLFAAEPQRIQARQDRPRALGRGRTTDGSGRARAEISIRLFDQPRPRCIFGIGDDRRGRVLATEQLDQRGWGRSYRRNCQSKPPRDVRSLHTLI
jgi:hypothetical protein